MPTSPAAYMTPAAVPSPGPGGSRRAVAPAAPTDASIQTTTAAALPSVEAVWAPERKREQQQPADGRRDADALCARQRRPSDRKHDDPARRRRLDERERRERERDDVEHPAGDAGEEPDRPAAAAEEERERMERTAQRERRQCGRRRVLHRVTAVDRGGGGDGEDEPERGH